MNEHDAWALPSEIHGRAGARGLYNPMQYVVRLHPEIHEDIAQLQNLGAREMSTEMVVSLSTALHETIHWWQHIGSTLGMVLSLAYPAQAHGNHESLLHLLSAVGPYKSLRAFQLKRVRQLSDYDEGQMNNVLNNWHDIEFARRFALDPNHARRFASDPYYESIGHSYSIAWEMALQLLAKTCDPEFEAVPLGRAWGSGFRDLTERKVIGFYHGSPLQLAPIGGRSIFESQARFSQLQYLHAAHQKGLSWSYFRSAGMLSELYMNAFWKFLELSDLQWPETLDDPVIALFLLVCDLSINPAEALPFPIQKFDMFIDDVDPGTRFYRFARFIQKSRVDIAALAAPMTRDAYIKAADVLCKGIGVLSSRAATERIAAWPELSSGFAQVMEEAKHWDFGEGNLPVRLFASRFIALQQAKLSHPELFVWPGVVLTGRKGREPNLQALRMLYTEHEPLFVTTPEGEVRARLIAGLPESVTLHTFDAFYRWNVFYNIVRQWQVEEGPFDLEFQWLTPAESRSDVEEWADLQFRKVYGCSTRDFHLLEA